MHSSLDKLKEALAKPDLFVLIVGSTGTGKTNDALHVAELSYESGSSVLILDPKGEYKHRLAVRRYLIGFSYDYLMLWNPLQPPLNLDPDGWIRAFAEAFVRAYNLGEPSRRILHDALEKLYLKYGVYEDPLIYPTLREVEREVRRYEAVGRRELDSKRALENRLRIANFGSMGDALNVPISAGIYEIFNYVSILDLSDLPSIQDQRFIVELLIKWISEYKRANLSDRVLTVVIEEAHRYIPERRDALSFLEYCIAEGRTHGLKFVILDQSPSLLSNQAMANCSVKIIHRLDNYVDIERMAKLIGVALHDVDTIARISRLERGRAIVSYPLGVSDYSPYPFLEEVKFPRYEKSGGELIKPPPRSEVASAALRRISTWVEEMALKSARSIKRGWDEL